MNVFTFELGIAGAERTNRKRVIVFRYLHGVCKRSKIVQIPLHVENRKSELSVSEFAPIESELLLLPFLLRLLFTFTLPFLNTPICFDQSVTAF